MSQLLADATSPDWETIVAVDQPDWVHEGTYFIRNRRQPHLYWYHFEGSSMSQMRKKPSSVSAGLHSRKANGYLSFVQTTWKSVPPAWARPHTFLKNPIATRYALLMTRGYGSLGTCSVALEQPRRKEGTLFMSF